MKKTKKRILVTKTDVGLRLDTFLSKYLKSRSQAIKMIQNQHVMSLSGNLKKPSYKVSLGEEFLIIFPLEKENPLTPISNLSVKKIYEDKHIVIVDKPAGLVVHPGAGHEKKTLVQALIKDTPLSSGTGELRPGVVHRLDKDVSGIMLFSKTKEAEQKLILDFKQHRIKKYYQAIGLGAVKESKTVVDNYIGRHPKDRKKFFCFKNPRPGAKKSITHFQVLKTWYKVHLLRCQTITGRTHQIRLHCKELGVPLLGDTLYGGGRPHKRLNTIKDTQVQNRIKTLKRVALYSSDLVFYHPVARNLLKFSIPWPNDLIDLVELFNFQTK